jgi:hypothetical protein
LRSSIEVVLTRLRRSVCGPVIRLRRSAIGRRLAEGLSMSIGLWCPRLPPCLLRHRPRYALTCSEADWALVSFVIEGT